MKGKRKFLLHDFFMTGRNFRFSFSHSCVYFFDSMKNYFLYNERMVTYVK
ncbi:hypothetical protein CK1_00300 [Ruminococcus sp. SR1/5]|nr:hypothetical protein CK1_00300 [Ruminococcus sp. SR1/5]